MAAVSTLRESIHAGFVRVRQIYYYRGSDTFGSASSFLPLLFSRVGVGLPCMNLLFQYIHVVSCLDEVAVDAVAQRALFAD